jgi:hypothetical protein
MWGGIQDMGVFGISYKTGAMHSHFVRQGIFHVYHFPESVSHSTETRKIPEETKYEAT